jgi:hypothetical protein
MEYLLINGSSNLSIEKDEQTVIKVFIDDKLRDFKEEPGKDKKEFATEVKRNKYGQFLNKQFENLVVLSGAGTSVGIGKDFEENGKTIARKGKLLRELWDDTVALLTPEKLNEFCDVVKYQDRTGGEYVKNLEKLLSQANAAKDFVEGGEIDIRKTVEKIEQLITRECDLLITENSPHEVFLERITKRKVTLPRTKIFTLNYDTLFEQAARIKGFTIIDGFTFSSPRIFSGSNFDYDIVLRDKRGVKEEDNFIKKVFQLYKPHGSIDWEKMENGTIQQTSKPKKALMIFPKDSKYENSYEPPFFEMISRFQQSLRNGNVLLICIGFSFSDKHIVAMIKEALTQNSGFQLVVVNRSIQENGNFKWLVDLAKIHSNIMLIAETFSDFALNYPELNTYNQDDNRRLVLLTKGKVDE